MGDCTTELPQQASVRASQQFEDLKLIHRSQAGDTEAFGELVTKYRAKVFAMIYSIVGDENDAWDVAQEAFLKAWWSIHQSVLYVVVHYHDELDDRLTSPSMPSQ
jgi:hypothetical protein